MRKLKLKHINYLSRNSSRKLHCICKPVSFTTLPAIYWLFSYLKRGKNKLIQFLQININWYNWCNFMKRLLLMIIYPQDRILRTLFADLWILAESTKSQGLRKFKRKITRPRRVHQSTRCARPIRDRRCNEFRTRYTCVYLDPREKEPAQRDVRNYRQFKRWFCERSFGLGMLAFLGSWLL